MSPPASILITGANVGIGKDAARQLALKDGVKKVILGCRNKDKAEAAVKDLEEKTGKKVFEILIIDVSDVESVRRAVGELKEAVDGLVLNAGGSGGTEPAELAGCGATNIAAVNLVGHVVLVDELIGKKLLSGTVVFSGSEMARDIPNLGHAAPHVKDGSVEEWVGRLDGSSFEASQKKMHMYGHVKLIAALWMGSMARSSPGIRFVTMSPGATMGTAIAGHAPWYRRMVIGAMFTAFRVIGQAHGVEDGAKRYVDALFEEETYKTGIFYASEEGTSGNLADQKKFIDFIDNAEYQDNASKAVHKFTG